VDNITHALVGLIAGEALDAHRRTSSPGLAPGRRRNVLVAVSIIGSNSPDLDLLASGAGSHLDYMLWHRGYTHTLPGCLTLALLLYGGTEIWLRAKRLEPSGADRLLLLGAAFLSTFLHLAMDYLNSYGVHPFWPWDSRWRYGDAVFIVEPLYWAAAAPLWFRLRTRTSRILYALAMLGVLVLGAASGMMSAGICALIACATLALVRTGRLAGTAGAARISALLALGVTTACILAGRAAAREAEDLARRTFSAERLLDHVLTPAPANPLCWDLWLLTRNGERYIARHAAVGLMPAIRTGAACGPRESEAHTAPLSAVPAADTAEIHWLGQFSLPRVALMQAASGNCLAGAFMLFSRAPFLSADPPLLGDLRFDRGRERGSFEIPLPESRERAAACPRTAPWVAPRAELLGP
jgi:inner membrane protein